VLGSLDSSRVNSEEIVDKKIKAEICHFNYLIFDNNFISWLEKKVEKIQKYGMPPRTLGFGRQARSRRAYFLPRRAPVSE